MTKGRIQIYTDGSCIGNPGKGGWAFLLLHSTPILCSGSEFHTTNNRMEMIALIEATKFLDKNKKYTVNTDSQYLINGYTKWMQGWRNKNWAKIKNDDLWKIIYKISKEYDLEFKWVKGHSDNEYNNLVDEEARKMANIH